MTSQHLEPGTTVTIAPATPYGHPTSALIIHDAGRPVVWCRTINGHQLIPRATITPTQETP